MKLCLFSRIINKERKEKFFKNLEKQLGVSLKEIAQDKISVTKSDKGIYLKPKLTVSKESPNSNTIEKVSTKGTGNIFLNFLNFFLVIYQNIENNRA